MAHNPPKGSSPPPTPGDHPDTAASSPSSDLTESVKTPTATRGGVVQRALERARNTTLLSRSQPTLPHLGDRDTLSKGKGKERQSSGGMHVATFVHVLS